MLLLSSRLIALGFAGFVGACGHADAPALGDESANEGADEGVDDADLARACAFDDVPFSATGAVLQAVSEDACVRLERAPVDVRRGTTWRATRLLVHAGRTFDSEADVELAYESSHHNCRDVVTGEIDGAALSLAIDGVSDDPSVCFDPSSSAWVLRLAIDGREWLLRPR